MSETPVTSNPNAADVSAYENLDLSQLNMHAEEEKPGEKKLEYFLVRTVFFAKIATWVGVGLLVLVGLYGYTRHQTQKSWLMNLPMNTASSPLCAWMNHSNQEILRRDTAFLEYLASEGKKDLVELDNSGKCLASDTIAEWLELQLKYGSKELGVAYEKVIPKKFMAVTIDASPELTIIAKNAPRNRVDHVDVLGTVSTTIEKMSDSTTDIACDEIRFEELNADLHCTVTTTPPVQPRKKALEFMEKLEEAWSLLVSYPNTLGMQIDRESQLLTTDFTAKITYIPARYEAETIEKFTYDKR